MFVQMSDEETGGTKEKEKGKEKDENLSSSCSVCGSPAAAHLHYGAVSCYSCRAFFRRGQPKQVRWVLPLLSFNTEKDIERLRSQMCI